MLEKNKTFGWKFALSRRILSDDRVKQHMEIIKGKFEGNYFAMNSMEQMIKIFEISRDNKIS